jgi:8-oxo-dGTP pyrophosphatase MutT (NUDIX family)
MQTSEFYFGRNGKLQHQVSDLSTVRNEITFDLDRMGFRPGSGLMCPTDQDGKINFISEQYRNWGRFGINGDLIKACPTFEAGGKKIRWTIEFIGRLDRPRPILAVDVVPIFYSCMADAHCVLIKRKFDPGKDEIALIGGHQEVQGFRFQTPAAAVKMELEEEAGLRIEPAHDEIFYRLPMAGHLRVKVLLNHELSVDSELQLIGTYETSDEENLPHLGRKRVDWTTAYFLPIYLGGKIPGIGPLVLDRWLKAGDDAKELVYVRYLDTLQESKRKLINFGILHHEAIFNRVADIFQSMPMHTLPMRVLD